MIADGALHGLDGAGDGQRIGLSLCGTGFSASLFHLGVLARLAELDLLRRVEVLSTVSGGAITGALYHLYLKRELDAHGEVTTGRLIELVAEMERHLLSVVQRDPAWQARATLSGSIAWARDGAPGAEQIGDLLDLHLYRPVWNGDHDRPVELREMAIHPRGDRDFNPITDNRGRHCKVPALIIHAATLNTGHGWRFETDRMGEPARGRAARQMDKNLRLGQCRYRGLVEPHAGMRLGRAVAASAAMPGVIAPLRLRHLYPRPDRGDRFLDVELADGSLHDPFGAAVLLERGCSHIVVSDGARRLVDQPCPGRRPDAINMRARGILLDQMRERHLARLDELRPGRNVLLHLVREIDAPEATPVGPANFGRVVRDRAEVESTSHGVQRRAQALLARLRTDVDAFGEVEAFALMADGYLMTRRAFQHLGQQGRSWTETPALAHVTWRFSAVADALGQPSAGLIKRLEAGRYRTMRGLASLPRLRVELGLVALLAALGLAAAATMLTSWLRHLDPVVLTGIVLMTAMLALAPPLGRGFSRVAQEIRWLAWLRRPLGWIGGVGALAVAPALYLVACWQLRAGRLLLKAGELRQIGIELPPAVAVRERPTDTGSPMTAVADKAA